MTVPYRCIWTLLAVLMVPVPVSADAGSSPEAADAQRKAAQAYLNLATTLFRDKDYEGALAELERAAPLLEKTAVFPLVRFNIARCYEELGLHLETLAAYRRYLETGEKSALRQKRAHQAIKNLRAEHIGRLIVNCDPKDAQVRLIEQDQARQGCPADFGEMLDGSYTVEVTRDGFQPEEREVYVKASTTTRTSVALSRQRVVQPRTSRPEESLTVVADARISRRQSQWWLWGSAALAGVTGAVFHGLAAKERSGIEETPPGASRDTMVDTFEMQRATSITLYGVSAILAGTALFVRNDDGEQSVSTWWITPTGFGASLDF